MLAVFHYIVGGFTALFSCLPFVHVAIGVAMISGTFANASESSGPPPMIGWFFIIMGSVFILIGWSIAICMIVAGNKLKAHKSRIFCMVVAAIECMFMPFGTILGVLTLIALSKDSIKEGFAQQAFGGNA